MVIQLPGWKACVPETIMVEWWSMSIQSGRLKGMRYGLEQVLWTLTDSHKVMHHYNIFWQTIKCSAATFNQHSELNKGNWKCPSSAVSKQFKFKPSADRWHHFLQYQWIADASIQWHSYHHQRTMLMWNQQDLHIADRQYILICSQWVSMCCVTLIPKWLIS